MTSVSRRLLAGRFVLDSRIGAGNYAEVYRATDNQSGELVAVKTLRPEHATESQALSLFIKEGSAGSAISHGNVVKISSYGENDGTHYIVMELVKGISLRRRIQLAGRLDVVEALRISVGTLRGLEAIHDAGYIHRDIKPQNILIDASGVPKITDFGITLCPGEARSSSGGLALGTAAYIAPEQAAGQQIGPEADIYSAGCVLFEMLTGEAPFPGDDPLQVMNRHLFEPPRDPRSLNPQISPALAAIVLRSLAKEPAARFRSAQRMREALEMLQEEVRLANTQRRLLPTRALAWNGPQAQPRHLPLGLANVPLMTTFVSALLLIVLFIVLVLALVSSAVNAGSSGVISSSGPPSGSAAGSTPNADQGTQTNEPQLADVVVPNWAVQAAVIDATPIPSPTAEQIADAVTPAPTEPPTPTTMVIYNDGLAQGWYTNLSWNGRLELINASTTHTHTDPISFTATDGWAGLQITNDAGVDTSPFNAIQFSIRSTTDNEPLAVYLRDRSYDNLSDPVTLTNYGGYPKATGWTTYTIPLADLNGSDVTLGSIVFHNWSDSPQAPILVDHIQLVQQP
ncbi:MAG: serine/threonine-protein kinase [Nitrolancea sp.]